MPRDEGADEAPNVVKLRGRGGILDSDDRSHISTRVPKPRASQG
jgi:hypothetical protein